MIDVRKMLYDICEDDAVYEDGIDLLDSGLLDSLACIELFYALEDWELSFSRPGSTGTVFARWRGLNV